MKIVKFNPYNGTNKVRAFFSFSTNDGIEVKDCTLVEGSSGFFINTPSKKGADEKYWDIVFIPKEIKEQVAQLAIEEYKKTKDNTSAAVTNDEAPF